jgi:hypothetical protein
VLLSPLLQAEEESLCGSVARQNKKESAVGSGIDDLLLCAGSDRYCPSSKYQLRGVVPRWGEIAFEKNFVFPLPFLMIFPLNFVMTYFFLIFPSLPDDFLFPLKFSTGSYRG